MTRAQTIQIFLPTGSPTGVKEAELTSRLIKVLYFPRNVFQKAAERELSSFTGVYFLFGEDRDGNSKVYIGEGENCWTRIKSHQRKKEFWTECIIASTKTNDYNKADVKYLEHLCLKVAEDVGRYHIDNDKASLLPSISESREADLQDGFATIKILLATLGFPLFEDQKSIEKIEIAESFFCRGKDAIAEGLITDEGVLVLKGSTANLDETKTIGSWLSGIRKRLLDQGILIESEGVLVFTKDQLFKAPSGAAGAVLGRRANGWKEWKDKSGRTLDELKRK
jgi:hypothetical protein